MSKNIISEKTKEVISDIKELSNDLDKVSVKIIGDMIKCKVKYKTTFHDYLDFEFHLLNDKQRSTYLPSKYHRKIIKCCNKERSRIAFNDKIEFSKIFNEYLKREWIYLREVKGDQFSEFLKGKRAIIVKSVSDEGYMIPEKINVNRNTDGKKLYRSLRKSGQVLVESFVKQHSDMNSLYKNAVNTVRIYTYTENDKATYLHGVLKIGNGGVVSKFKAGGLVAYLNTNGKVTTNAVDVEDNIYTIHPKTKVEFKGFEIPMYKQAIELAKEASLMVPGVKYASWDIAITEDGPLLIQASCEPTLHQAKPSLLKIKEGLLNKYQKVVNLKDK